MMRSPVLALAFLALAGCGFTPVYGPGPSSTSAGLIKIPEIEGRMGHFLRQDLVQTVGRGVPGIAGSAELEVKLRESIARLAFTPDQAASRSDYIGDANWTLRRADGSTIAKGSAHEAASFNFADAAYADIAAQTAAKERVATLLARTIRDQVIIAAGKPAATQPGTEAVPVTTPEAPQVSPFLQRNTPFPTQSTSPVPVQ